MPVTCSPCISEDCISLLSVLKVLSIWSQIPEYPQMKYCIFPAVSSQYDAHSQDLKIGSLRSVYEVLIQGTSQNQTKDSSTPTECKASGEVLLLLEAVVAQPDFCISARLFSLTGVARPDCSA
eukprot:724088-Pelagomonas_calceolata.AAC.2